MAEGPVQEAAPVVGGFDAGRPGGPRGGPHGRIRHHVRLAVAVAVAVCALVVAHRPSMWPAVVVVAAIPLAIHAVIAIAFGVLLAAGMRSHAHGRGADRRPGATIRWARLYDWLALVRFGGNEGAIRDLMLDKAAVAAGERVLDVCCGTGTLALAAAARVGPSGTVVGVDAATEMVQRARVKSADKGLPVRFEVAAAQSLPFAAAEFDVVLCTLGLHHMDDDARAEAIREMRRVLKPLGRALVVEFGEGAVGGANVVARMHARRNPRIVAEVAAAMGRAGLEGITAGDLGCAGLAYVLAGSPAPRTGAQTPSAG